MCIIDFDDTLFDTQFFIRDICRVFETHGVTPEDARRTMTSSILDERTNVYDYTFERHVEAIIARGYNIPRDVVLGDLRHLTEKKDYSFSDAVLFLKRLVSLGQRCILLSAGNESFQRMKFDSTLFEPYFEEVVFVPSHKEVYVASHVSADEPLFFINDKSPENEAVKTAVPDAIVITKHNPYKAVGDYAPTMQLPTFDSLLDIATYVETYSR